MVVVGGGRALNGEQAAVGIRFLSRLQVAPDPELSPNRWFPLGAVPVGASRQSAMLLAPWPAVCDCTQTLVSPPAGNPLHLILGSSSSSNINNNSNNRVSLGELTSPAGRVSCDNKLNVQEIFIFFNFSFFAF